MKKREKNKSSIQTKALPIVGGSNEDRGEREGEGEGEVLMNCVWYEKC